MIGNVVFDFTCEVGSHAKEPAENAARNQAIAWQFLKFDHGIRIVNIASY